MADASLPMITTPLISALIGGVSVAIINYFLNRRKTAAEIKKLTAETEKIQAEMKNLTQAVNDLSDTTELLIFDGSTKLDGFALQGRENNIWSGFGKEAKPISPKGEGTLNFEEGGIVNIQRTNKDGRFEITLKQYLYDNKTYSCLPKNERISGKRKLHISCEAKSARGEHSLKFIIRDVDTNSWMADQSKIINRNEWIPVQIFFQIDPTRGCELRIYDEKVSMAPSSIQIRNLVLAERQS